MHRRTSHNVLVLSFVVTSESAHMKAYDVGATFGKSLSS